MCVESSVQADPHRDLHPVRHHRHHYPYCCCGLCLNEPGPQALTVPSPLPSNYSKTPHASHIRIHASFTPRCCVFLLQLPGFTVWVLKRCEFLSRYQYTLRYALAPLLPIVRVHSTVRDSSTLCTHISLVHSVYKYLYLMAL